jgi:hypothetical protein
MESKASKQNIGWGVLLICFGIVAMLDIYYPMSDWLDISIFFVGGLIASAIFWTDRSNWVLLIPVYVMWAIALIGAVAILDLLQGDIIGSLVLTLIGVPFLVVYLRNRGDDLIAPFILYAIAVPFLVVYFINREHWWALIPAYTMVVIGTMVGLIETGILSDMIIPAYINLAIAIPFFVVYFRNKENWWALIPGGIMGLIGLGFLLSEPVGQFLIPAALILVGGWILVRQFIKK